MTNSTPMAEVDANDPTSALRTDQFDYDLPPELIAQEPLPARDASRLLVVDRERETLTHSSVRDLGRFLRAGDLLVANNSRVLPARLHAVNPESGGKLEFLLLHSEAEGRWLALARPARRLRPGTIVRLTSRDGRDSADVEVVENRGDGQVVILVPDPVEVDLGRWGEVPLPPYVRQMVADPNRYQTVYARTDGSAAAPTAGLHFTTELIELLGERGIGWAEVTLHVGLDTFRPVKTERLQDHHIHREWCEISDETARRIAATRTGGGRIIAVGTTAARTLETLGRAWNNDHPRGFAGLTDIFILPGHRWRLVDGLLTNFHLPRTTLLAMVSALAGWDQIRQAYGEAIAQRYRFYSFGDAMLII